MPVRILNIGFALLVAVGIAVLMLSALKTSPEDATNSDRPDHSTQSPNDKTSFPEGTFDVPPGIPVAVTAKKFERLHLPIIESILAHALTSEVNEGAIRFYGRGSNQVLLKSFGSTIEWPADFEPKTEGFQFRRSRDGISTKTALGVDLRQYGPITADDDTQFYFGSGEGVWKVVLVIYNAKGGSIIGGQRTYYSFNPDSSEFQYCGAID